MVLNSLSSTKKLGLFLVKVEESRMTRHKSSSRSSFRLIDRGSSGILPWDGWSACNDVTELELFLSGLEKGCQSLRQETLIVGALSNLKQLSWKLITLIWGTSVSIQFSYLLRYCWQRIVFLIKGLFQWCSISFFPALHIRIMLEHWIWNIDLNVR